VWASDSCNAEWVSEQFSDNERKKTYRLCDDILGRIYYYYYYYYYLFLISGAYPNELL
jgi:hypothetical protein